VDGEAGVVERAQLGDPEAFRAPSPGTYR
jgi:hypothetical protein